MSASISISSSPKILARLPAVDFINDEKPIPLRVIPREAARTGKTHRHDALDRRVGRISLNEILVAVTRVKLNHRNAALVALTHQCKSQPTGDECLPDAWRPLKDDGFLALNRARIVSSSSGDMNRPASASAFVNGAGWSKWMGAFRSSGAVADLYAESASGCCHQRRDQIRVNQRKMIASLLVVNFIPNL